MAADILRLRDLAPGTIFRMVQAPGFRGVTTRFKDGDLSVLCVELDRYPGTLEPMLEAMPVIELVTALPHSPASDSRPDTQRGDERTLDGRSEGDL